MISTLVLVDGSFEHRFQILIYTKPALFYRVFTWFCVCVCVCVFFFFFFFDERNIKFELKYIFTFFSFLFFLAKVGYERQTKIISDG